jgi:RNA polymerase sigma-70 factor, ECF subfamily
MELAFLTAIQQLPGRQRPILILRDVLGWTSPEVAELVDSTTARSTALCSERGE